MNRLHTQLLLDQLVDEGKRQLRRCISSTGRLADLVAVTAGDPIAMMAVGYQHIIGSQVLNSSDPLPIGDAFQHMLNAVIRDGAQRLARLREQLGSGLATAKAPKPGTRLAPVARVRSRRSLDASAVVRSCGSTPPGLEINDFQPAEHPSDVAPRASRVGETHAVDSE